MASALGMRVIVLREHVEKGSPEGVEAVFPPPAINEVLKQSDYIVLAAPLIAATHGLINADRLAAMKPGACLINV
jgi:phosphoglycerate dehydrogenase-like enzyme